MRTDGGFKNLPEKQHERKKKKKEGWMKQKTRRKRERESEKGEEMDRRMGSQERERERRMVNEKKRSLILKRPALHHNYRPKIPKNSCQTE